MKKILFAFFILANSVYVSYAASNNFAQYYKRINGKLDAIKTYEMHVQFSEAMTSDESDFSEFNRLLLNVIKEFGEFKNLTIPAYEKFKKLIDLKSICSMSVKYKKPNRLFVDAIGNFMPQGKGGAGERIIRIYTTFDGSHQKARFSIEFNGNNSAKSIIMDSSINSAEQPFDGWNLKGFGFVQGSDYIGTIKSLLYRYDFKLIKRNDNIFIFSGMLNRDRLIAAYPISIPKEAAKSLVEMDAKFEKSFNIEFDTKSDLIVGYYGEYNSALNIVKRICRFEDIQINRKIDDSVFSFTSLPNEKYVDITDLVRNSRKPRNIEKQEAN